MPGSSPGMTRVRCWAGRIAPGPRRQAPFRVRATPDRLSGESSRSVTPGHGRHRRSNMSLANFRDAAATVPNDLESYWIGFTPNRAFKKAPRLIVRAKDMHYYRPDGRPVLDG